MRGSILDILVRIHQVINAPKVRITAQPDIVQELLIAGFTYEHIRKALQWRDRFFEEMPHYQENAHPQHALRLYTPEENQKISYGAREFIQKLESMNIIDLSLREFIIDQAMRLDLDVIETPYFIWVVYMALDNQHGRTGDYSWLETEIFDHSMAEHEPQPLH